MREFDVVVVGDGPAALGAAVTLVNAGVSVAIVSAATIPDPAPRYLTERAVAEIQDLGLELPESGWLGFVEIAATKAKRPLRFVSRTAWVDPTRWRRYLNAEIRRCGHTVVRGHATLANAGEGTIDVLQGWRRMKVRGQLVIWAAGAPPAAFRRTPNAVITVSEDSGSWADFAPTPSPALRFTFSRGDWTGEGAAAHWSFPTVSTVVCGRIDLQGADALERTMATCIDSGVQHAVVRPVFASYERVRCAMGRVMLVGGAAGLINSFTGEGISYAIASGRISAISALSGDTWRQTFIREAGIRFGFGRTHTQEQMRRHSLAVKAISDGLESRSPARDRIIGAVLDHGLAIDGRTVYQLGRVRTWPTVAEPARRRIQSITAQEASLVWLSASPSLAKMPTLPDVRLSDVLLACSAVERDSPRAALAGACVDLLVASIGLLAGGVSDDANRPPSEHRRSRNWAEIASVVSCDVLSARALRLAAQVGNDVFEVVTLWISSTVSVRESVRGNPQRSALELYELAFDLPCRLATLLNPTDEDAQTAIVDVGHILGAAYALGDEERLLGGSLDRLGLSADEAAGYRLRCSEDEILVRWGPAGGAASTRDLLRRRWQDCLSLLQPGIDPLGHQMLDSIFEACLDDAHADSGD